MTKAFITVLNMSLTASYVALVVMTVRMFLKKAPKIFSYALWAVVLFRLVCPFSFESILSFIPTNINAIPQDIIYTQTPAIHSGVGVMDNAINSTIQNSIPLARPEASVNPMGIIVWLGSNLWILGVIILLSYGAFSYLRLKHCLSTAIRVQDNIYETDRIETPFVLGLIRPKIYLPAGLESKELEYILKHEQTHIKRRDYLIKPVAFLALAIHWFNPIIWLSFVLMVKDMEMSCDESVLKQSGEDVRGNYSNSLLSLSAKQSGLLSPLAFGESNVKARITNVLHYKKPVFWALILAVAVVAIVLVGLVANPENKIVYKNETLGFSLKFSGDWRDKYIIEESENEISVFSKEVYRDADGAGLLFSIERQIGELITEEDMLQAPVDQQIVLQGNGYTYIARIPSDVQYPPDDEALRSEYKMLFEQISDVYRSISLLGNRKPQATNEGFKVEGTSFFTVEIPKDWNLEAVEGFPPCWGIYNGNNEVGYIDLIPFYREDSDSVNTPEAYGRQMNFMNDKTFRKAQIRFHMQKADRAIMEKIENSFEFVDGPYNVVDLLSAAQEYQIRGGKRIFGKIDGFDMENGKPVAVRVKVMEFISDGPEDNNPNGFYIQDLNQIKTYSLDFGVSVVPLVAPNYNTYGIYEIPLLDENFIKNYANYKDFFYDFIIGNDGKLKIVLGHYIP